MSQFSFQEHVYNVNSEGDAASKKDSNAKTQPKKGQKSRQFTKLSRKYQKLGEDDSILEEVEEDTENQPNKKGGRKLRKDTGRTASKSSDLSFDLLYNLTKKKKASGKSSSSDDCNVSPISGDGDVECLALDDVIETSTPCDVKQQSIIVEQSFETKGHITRRRAKRAGAFSPDKQGRKRPKRQCVSKMFNIEFQ